MVGSFDHLVVKAWRGKTAEEIVAAPIDALNGVSAADAQHLREAFGITTVADLAGHRYTAAAQAIADAAAGTGHDRGPDPEWSHFLEQAPHDTYQAHPNDFRLDFGPVWYRGRLDGTARVLVVGQDPAANELIGHRIFVGLSGQRVQGFLRKLGIARDYLMANTFLYPVFGQFFMLEALSHDPQIEGFRNALFDRIAERNPLEAVVAVGAAARDAVERWSGGGALVVQEVTHPSAPNHAALLGNWNVRVELLRSTVRPENGVAPDLTPYGSEWTDADLAAIPRCDLPFGVPSFHGVGSRAARLRVNGTTDDKAIVWRAP